MIFFYKKKGNNLEKSSKSFRKKMGMIYKKAKPKLF